MEKDDRKTAPDWLRSMPLSCFFSAALGLPTEIGMPRALRPIELDLSLLLSILDRRELFCRQWWITEWNTKKWKKNHIRWPARIRFALQNSQDSKLGLLVGEMFCILFWEPWKPCTNFPWNILKPGRPRIHRSPRFSSALWEVATIGPIHQAGPKGVPYLA